jgi:hypothetical protein
LGAGLPQPDVERIRSWCAFWLTQMMAEEPAHEQTLYPCQPPVVPSRRLHIASSSFALHRVLGSLLSSAGERYVKATKRLWRRHRSRLVTFM